MTRGSEVTAIRQEVRARRNRMIRQRKLAQGKMLAVAESTGDKRFARLAEKAEAIHCIARELTPGPRGSGED
jgi:hypothetical protein